MYPLDVIHVLTDEETLLPISYIFPFYDPSPAQNGEFRLGTFPGPISRFLVR